MFIRSMLNIVTAPVKPFKMTYQTDNTEGVVVVPNPPTASIPFAATADTANTGFCLDYQER